MKHLALIVLCSALIHSGIAIAAEDGRIVKVTGRAEVRVAPDEAVIRVGIESINEELAVAKRENDKIASGAMEAIEKFGVNAGRVKTDYLKIEPVYGGSRSGPKVLEGYRVSNSIQITLSEVGLVEGLLSSLLIVGVNRVDSVEFRTSEFRSHRDQAVLLALDAAKEKASAMAEHLGSSIGKPVEISEGSPISRPSMANTIQPSGSSGSMEYGPIAPGELSIPAVVSVSFELVD